jgi:hypothetical protein
MQINLNQIIESAHEGEAMNSLAEQFDITPEQAEEAVHALIPALSMGLQQQMQQGGIGQILSHIATKQNVAAFDDADAAQSDETIASGTDVLNYLFGNEQVSEQVAANAAAHSSLGADLLRNMLPVIAAMVMGGLFKQIAARGGLGGMFGGGAQAAPAPAPQPRADTGGGGLGDILGKMTGQQTPAPAPQQGGGGGLGDILGGMLGGAKPQPQAAPQGGGGGGLGDILGQLAGGAKPQGQPQAPSGGGGLGDILGQLAGGQRAPQGQQGASGGGGGLGDLLGQILGGGAAAQPGGQAQAQPRQGGGGGLGDILGQLAGAQRGGPAPGGGGGALGDILGQVLGGGARPQAGAPAQPQGGGLDQAILKAGLDQLQNMFGHGSKVSPQQQSGLDSILGQILGGGRR